jgi:hypothetical protein
MVEEDLKIARRHALLKEHGAAREGCPRGNILTRTHAELDLTNQAAVHAFMAEHKPDVVILAAAKVGGIHANNTYPAEFIYENLDDGGQCHPRRPPRGRAEPPLPRLLLHLSQRKRRSRWRRMRC